MDWLRDYQAAERRRQWRGAIISYLATASAAAIGTLLGVLAAAWWYAG